MKAILQKTDKILSKQQYDIPFLLILLTFETILCTLILTKISYTEIDWKAYMEQVSIFQSGELDYIHIKGNTGPLVYPAAFLYLYSCIRYFCGEGSEESDAIVTAQWIFILFYLCTFGVISALYTSIARRLSSYQQQSSSTSSSTIIWSWRIAILILTISKRIHSIYILRLFNDGPTMLFTYMSFYLFTKHYFKIGCIVYSISVGIKMNTLLFAPGLLLIFLQQFSTIWETISCLTICALVQILLGLPFLCSHPINYIRKAFEFDRVFFYKWTVNWKFLSEELFVSKQLSILLLLLHIIFLFVFVMKWLNATSKQTGGSYLPRSNNLTPEYILLTLFTSNFIGIVFSRTLHYQFYTWYFHSIPFMLWISSSSSSHKVWTICRNIGIVAVIEYSFNVYPATPTSSALLQLSHLFVLFNILFMDLSKNIYITLIGGSGSSTKKEGVKLQ